jgi:two-component system chemotaxis sensor kinase CheA
MSSSPEQSTPAEAVYPKLAADEIPQVAMGIRIKLIALMAGTILVIVGALASYFPARQVGELRTGLRDRAAVYAQLASQQLRSSIAFSDQETAREVLGALRQDPLIDGIAVYNEQGRRLHGEGTLSDVAQQARFGFSGPQRTFYLQGRVLATAPVTSLEGPRGTLVLELSTRSANDARDRLIRVALLVGCGALLLGTLAAWLIARSLANRVEKVADLTRAVARGELDRSLDVNGQRDEIGVLSHGFNAMVRRLRELIEHIHRTANEESVRLERLVAERTQQLDRKNKDLRLVLDNVEQGFVTIDRAGRVVGQHSRSIEDWLGPLSQESCLWSSLDGRAPGASGEFSLGWAQVVDGVLPLELTLDQMPNSLEIDGRRLRFEYKPIGGDDFDKLLVVISDVTAVVERERTEQEARDILNATSCLLADRAGFLQFFSETEELIRHIDENRSELATLKRDLHTLKGNTAVFGMARLSGLCHELESELESRDAASLDRSALRIQWDRTCAQIKRLIGEGDAMGSIAVDSREYVAVLDAIRRGVDKATLERMVAAWRLEPFQVRLTRIGEQLSGLAARLGKGEVKVDVSAPHLYLAREELSEFWGVFAHVVRNAAVHGLETPEARDKAGKPAVAGFGLRAGIEKDRLFVELADSGPGIDWEGVRARAVGRGLRHTTEADLTKALFTDGISTRSGVTAEAGRGVGLSAVRQVCSRLSGEIDVKSTRGKGTCFRFSWPASQFKTLTLIDVGAQ